MCMSHAHDRCLRLLADLTRDKLTTDYFENACEYYDFLYNKKTVKFAAHPTRCDETKYPPFELTMSAKNSYDDVAERVGAMVNAPPTHIRFWTVNNTTGNPKTPVKRSATSNLLSMLHTGTYTQAQQSYRVDAFFFEVLEISLEELEFKKSVKLTWLSEGITKEVRTRAGRQDKAGRVLTSSLGHIRPARQQERHGRGPDQRRGAQSQGP